MALKVVWTTEAEQSLDEIIDYLETNWTPKQVSDFFKRLDYCIDKIQENPSSQKNSTRKRATKEYQHSEQTTIFYDFDAENIYLLLIWSNKKNPKSLI